MPRQTYVYDKNQKKVVPIEERTDHTQRGGPAFHAMSDIRPFVTTDGVEITSRSGLRAYEQERGVKQVGSDWTGSQKPRFWDAHRQRERARGRA